MQTLLLALDGTLSPGFNTLLFGNYTLHIVTEVFFDLLFCLCPLLAVSGAMFNVSAWSQVKNDTGGISMLYFNAGCSIVSMLKMTYALDESDLRSLQETAGDKFSNRNLSKGVKEDTRKMFLKESLKVVEEVEDQNFETSGAEVEN